MPSRSPRMRPSTAARHGRRRRRSGCWPAWDGVPGPAVAFDDVGNAYLVALPFQGATPMAIAVYKSTDGGVTWSAPNLIHSAAGDVKQSAAGDTNPASPHHGNVYAAWDGPGGLLFGRTTDHGATWTGTGANPVGSSLAPASFAPQVVVAVDGTVYIFFMDFPDVQFVKSTDGGNSFGAPQTVAQGITGLPGSTAGRYLPHPDGPDRLGRPERARPVRRLARLSPRRCPWRVFSSSLRRSPGGSGSR
jgi:hypothetical protein